VLHLGGVGEYVSKILGWSVNSWESGDLQKYSIFMIVTCCYIGDIDKLTILQKTIIGNCLFSVILSILAPILALSTVF
jgi:hypothetical protein